MKNLVLIISMFWSLVTFGLPSTTPLSNDALTTAQIILENSEQIKQVLNTAGIIDGARFSSGNRTRLGAPGKYSDRYVFEVTRCGPTNTSPCRLAGVLTVEAFYSMEFGKTSVRYEVSFR